MPRLYADRQWPASVYALSSQSPGLCAGAPGAGARPSRRRDRSPATPARRTACPTEWTALSPVAVQTARPAPPGSGRGDRRSGAASESPGPAALGSPSFRPAESGPAIPSGGAPGRAEAPRPWVAARAAVDPMVSGSGAPWAAVGALAPAVRAALAQPWEVLPAVVQPAAVRAAVVGSLAAGPSAAGLWAVGSSAAVSSAGPARPGSVLPEASPQMQEARRWVAPTAGLASAAACQAPPAPAGAVN